MSGSHNRPAGITELLQAWGAGDQHALERLTPLVYPELLRIARHFMRGEKAPHTLQATALVHEAYLRLVDVNVAQWQDRAHFFAVCARMMRRILVSAARRRTAGKRGGGGLMLDWNESIDAGPVRDDQMIRLDDALEALAKLDARKAKVVELRFFGGLDVRETSEVLKTSEPTVMRDWKLARTWLAREMEAHQ
ncbi:MAG TPA: sigma-70 family RNA polymerase sigma factor [Candidatus Limnocylindrales bacterium]|nr:sigma-70 family RNA polymerase sigma factor [Candidatus Limnocylindrales bacterium]